jgi:hypothetical protein
MGKNGKDKITNNLPIKSLISFDIFISTKI